MLLEGRVALVTGAGRGIGAAIARRFSQEGASVAIHYLHSRDSADALAREIGGIAVQADLASETGAAELLSKVAEWNSRLDILVNTASSFAHDQTFEASKWVDFQREFDGVVGVTVNTIRAAIPIMKQQGYGRIINFAATLIQRPTKDTIVHTTAKSALIGLTRTLARDFGPYGITVNMISPGMTLTDYSKSLTPEVQKIVLDQTPLRRLATPDDPASVAVFYASHLADFVTSANIAPDGGLAVL